MFQNQKFCVVFLFVLSVFSQLSLAQEKLTAGKGFADFTETPTISKKTLGEVLTVLDLETMRINNGNMWLAKTFDRKVLFDHEVGPAKLMQMKSIKTGNESDPEAQFELVTAFDQLKRRGMYYLFKRKGPPYAQWGRVFEFFDADGQSTPYSIVSVCNFRWMHTYAPEPRPWTVVNVVQETYSNKAIFRVIVRSSKVIGFKDASPPYNQISDGLFHYEVVLEWDANLKVSNITVGTVNTDRPNPYDTLSDSWYSEKHTGWKPSKKSETDGSPKNTLFEMSMPWANDLILDSMSGMPMPKPFSIFKGSKDAWDKAAGRPKLVVEKAGNFLERRSVKPMLVLKGNKLFFVVDEVGISQDLDGYTRKVDGKDRKLFDAATQLREHLGYIADAFKETK